MVHNYMQKLESAFKNELSGCAISIKEIDPHAYERNLKMEYTDAVIENLRSRFLDISIISIFGIFNPERIPETSSEDYSSYGTDKLSLLKEHFGESMLNHASLSIQWVYLSN